MSNPTIDTAELSDLIEKMRTPKSSYDPEAELYDAADFVADFGAFGDLFEGEDLTRARHWRGDTRAAWALLGHWSVQRGDPAVDAPDTFDEHANICPTCMYLEEVWLLRVGFQYENCHECGLGLDQHDIGPDPIGKAHPWCRDIWTRSDPAVGPGGQPAENMVSDAFDARWTAKLSDGHFAVVTRTFYVAAELDADSEETGVQYMAEQVEYIVCTDQMYPGDTEVASELLYVDYVDSETMDPKQMATDVGEPEPGDWQHNAPEAYRDLLVGSTKLAA